MLKRDENRQLINTKQLMQQRHIVITFNVTRICAVYK